MSRITTAVACRFGRRSRAREISSRNSCLCSRSPTGPSFAGSALGIDPAKGLFPRAATQSGPEHVARTVDAYPQHECPGAGVPQDSLSSLPNNRQRLLQRIFGVLGDPRDPPDRPQHLVLDRPDQRVVTRSATQMSPSVRAFAAIITGRPRHSSLVTGRMAGNVYKKKSV